MFAALIPFRFSAPSSNYTRYTGNITGEDRIMCDSPLPRTGYPAFNAYQAILSSTQPTVVR